MINNNLVIDPKFYDTELQIINLCKNDKLYLNIFKQALILIENNDDLSLSYIILDEQNNCLLKKGGSKNKKYIIQLYNYAT